MDFQNYPAPCIVSFQVPSSKLSIPSKSESPQRLKGLEPPEKTVDAEIDKYIISFNFRFLHAQ